MDFDKYNTLALAFSVILLLLSFYCIAAFSTIRFLEKELSESYELNDKIRAGLKKVYTLQVRTFYKRIEHGEDDHRKWLKDEFEKHFGFKIDET